MTGAGNDVDVIWDEFEDWLGRHQPKKLGTLRPPATVAEVTELEVTLGRELPDDVRRSLLRHDGEQEYQRSVHPAFALLSVAEAAQTISGNRRLGDEEDFGDWWWRDSYLPIASSGSGDYCCIDLDAEPGADDRVIIWYHDDLDRPAVGTSYVQWLSQVVEDYRRTWDLDLLEPWAGHREIIEDLDWSGDGSRLLTVGDHCLARLWDAQSGRAIADIDDVPSRTFTARFSPDGTRFAVAGSYLRIFDTDRPGDVAVPLATPQHWYSTSIGWLDGHRIAALTMDQFEVWDTRTGALEVGVPLDDALRGQRTLAVSPRGEAIVVVASSAMARIDLMPGEASVAKMVTTQRRFHGFAADWSPDARRRGRSWRPVTSPVVFGSGPSATVAGDPCGGPVAWPADQSTTEPRTRDSTTNSSGSPTMIRPSLTMSSTPFRSPLPL
ncbi:MAG: SMI1/KNR4 family protein, partial [Actinomycetota bacterium]